MNKIKIKKKSSRPSPINTISIYNLQPRKSQEEVEQRDHSLLLPSQGTGWRHPKGKFKRPIVEWTWAVFQQAEQQKSI
jgi:hypothetical protein